LPASPSGGVSAPGIRVRRSSWGTQRLLKSLAMTDGASSDGGIA
jgi:hypothetical protein